MANNKPKPEEAVGAAPRRSATVADQLADAAAENRRPFDKAPLLLTPAG